MANSSSNHTDLDRPALMPLLLRFAGSMNLAIMLLVIIAIASVIGTLLQQNQPYQDYIIKFGPFWHRVYQALGLYDVYASAWFILILAFLVVSTSICVIRNGPDILRSMNRFREDIQERNLQRMKQQASWDTRWPKDELERALPEYLRKIGYRTRIKQNGELVTIAAMKGHANRIGYLLTHLAIIVICIGGLLDGNLPLKVRTLTGATQIETEDMPVSEIPAASRLPADNRSFRSSVSIPEGATVNYSFINIANGYLLQKLPFAIEVKDFRIEHYNNGQPKSFESDVVIHDPANRNNLQETIAVNHPLQYRGYNIFQSSFSDGGTKLQLDLHGLETAQDRTIELTATINQAQELQTPAGKVHLEFEDFRRFNIFPSEDKTSDKKFVNYGPSFQYKIRQVDGSAREYVNYMLPVYIDDRDYFISGVRSSPNEEFHYLYIPVDNDRSMQRFLRYHALLNDERALRDIAQQASSKALSNTSINRAELETNLGSAMLLLVNLYLSGGFSNIATYIHEEIPQEEQETAMQAYLKVLRTILEQAYLHLLSEERGETVTSLTSSERQYLEEAVDAIGSLRDYGAGFILKLKSFDQRQATGLQITRTPGKNLVYLGFVLLIGGVFLLFYVPHQRLWLLIREKADGTRVLFAGTRTRHRHEFHREFQQLSRKLKQITQ